jgi:hypothetical protein
MTDELLRLRRLYVAVYGTKERDFFLADDGIMEATENSGGWAIEDCPYEIRELIAALLQYASDHKNNWVVRPPPICRDNVVSISLGRRPGGKVSGICAAK